jgi:hypothetical protein
MRVKMRSNIQVPIQHDVTKEFKPQLCETNTTLKKKNKKKPTIQLQRATKKSIQITKESKDAMKSQMKGSNLLCSLERDLGLVRPVRREASAREKEV